MQGALRGVKGVAGCLGFDFFPQQANIFSLQVIFELLVPIPDEHIDETIETIETITNGIPMALTTTAIYGIVPSS